MSYDILVIAGTTEARDVISENLKKGRKILASVATELGADMLCGYDVDVHIGRLDEAGFEKLILEKGVASVIDASHPFARIVTETVKKVCRNLGISYERYERRSMDYDYDRIHRVEDAMEAVAFLNGMEGNVLLTTGVNTAALYYDHVHDAENRLYIRVLDNEASREGCKKAGYPEEHVYAVMPPFTVDDNLEMIRDSKAEIMVSKDSGKNGGVDVKVHACKEAGIPMLLISRPKSRD